MNNDLDEAIEYYVILMNESKIEYESYSESHRGFHAGCVQAERKYKEYQPLVAWLRELRGYRELYSVKKDLGI